MPVTKFTLPSVASFFVVFYSSTFFVALKCYAFFIRAAKTS
ncbi:hypothetical protein AGMMS49579_26020 [Spirochaetia bacterium]|nr:hypothetical protein AGMMS49579_26020 [Spirochaetia bacterium]